MMNLILRLSISIMLRIHLQTSSMKKYKSIFLLLIICISPIHMILSDSSLYEARSVSLYFLKEKTFYF